MCTRSAVLINRALWLCSCVAYKNTPLAQQTVAANRPTQGSLRDITRLGLYSGLVKLSSTMSSESAFMCVEPGHDSAVAGKVGVCVPRDPEGLGLGSPGYAERYRASMILSGVGDAMGYRAGQWEFCLSGKTIHEDLEAMGGLDSLILKGRSWLVSDDTVMHLATAEALIKQGSSQDKEQLYSGIAEAYKECMHDMIGRAPGPTSMSGCNALRPGQPKGYVIPFNSRGGGCGAAMRSMAIGLRYPKAEDVDELIAVSVEAGRMTHNLPTGYLGSLAAALFVHYAVQGRPLEQWGPALLGLKDRVWAYVEEQGRDVSENKAAWSYFWDAWSSYLKLRGLTDGAGPVYFPAVYGVEERDAFYTSISHSGWGGASGHDSVIIAYDSLLGAGESWRELCLRGVLHGGDNDSTGVIAGACYGAMHGFRGVPPGHYRELEYRSRLENVGDELLKLSGYGQH